MPVGLFITTLIKDTSSKNFGTLDGYTLCGSRQAHLIDLSSNLEVDLTGLKGITMSSDLSTLSFVPTIKGT